MLKLANKTNDDDALPVGVLRTTVRALGDLHRPEQHEIGRRIELLVASSPELPERTAHKHSTITAALEAALTSRLGDRHLAGVLADIGVRAYHQGFASWTCADPDTDLESFVLDELDALGAVLSNLPRAAMMMPGGHAHGRMSRSPPVRARCWP